MAIIEIKKSSIIRKGFFKLDENDHLKNGRYTLIKTTDFETNKTHYEIIYEDNIKRFDTLEKVESFLESLSATGTLQSIKDANDYMEKIFPLITDEELIKEEQLILKEVRRNKSVEHSSVKKNFDNPIKGNATQKDSIDEIKLTKNYKLKRYNELNIALFRRVETQKCKKWKALRYYADFEEGLKDAIKYLGLKKISLFNLCQSLTERRKSINYSQGLDKEITIIKNAGNNWQHIVYGGYKRGESNKKINTLNLSSED